MFYLIEWVIFFLIKCILDKTACETYNTCAKIKGVHWELVILNKFTILIK